MTNMYEHGHGTLYRISRDLSKGFQFYRAAKEEVSDMWVLISSGNKAIDDIQDVLKHNIGKVFNVSKSSNIDPFTGKVVGDGPPIEEKLFCVIE